jgi:ankyrin repeat protein
MTPDSVRRTLKRLPKTLDETYARILMNIGEDEQPIVRRALRWLVFSERDLTIDELAEASIIDLEREHCIDTSERFTPGDLLHALSGLVTTAFPGDAFGIEDASYNDLKDACKDEVEGETTLQLVRLAHFSVKEYLLSDRLGTSCLNKYALDTSECTLFLTKSCLAYIEHVMRSRLDTWLNTDGWKETWAQNSNTSWTKNYRICCGQFPLLPYATRMWYRHQRRHLGQDESLQIIDSIIHKFYTDLELNWKWLSLVTLAHTVRESVPLLHTYYFRLEPSDYYREAQRSGISIWGAALVSASVFGLVSVVEFCLARGDLIAGTLELSLDISVGAPGYNDIGHATDNIRLLGALLAVGVYRVDNGQAALYKAIEGGDDAVICLLLENGAVLDRELRPSSIPIRYRWRYGLELACASGCSIQILSLLIEHGADIERGSHCTPLVNAICHRRIDAARLLLEHGADVEHAMSSRIPLHEACKVGYADMVELLLEHGAAVNRVSQENDLVGALVGDLVGLGSSALSIAARHGATSSIESLARHGADLQHCNSEGFNALQSAFSCGSHYYSTDVVFSRETATMLLKLGLDPTIHKVYPRSWALDSMLQWVVQQALEICMVPADAWLQEPDHHAVYQAYSKLVLAGASVEDCQAVVIEHLQTTWQECFDLMLSKNALLTLEDGSTMLARDRAFELGEAGNEKLLRLLIVNGMRKSEAETRSPKAQRKLKYSNHYAMAGFDDMLGRIEEEG